MKQRNSPSKNEIKILKIQENIAKNKEMSVELLYNFLWQWIRENLLIDWEVSWFDKVLVRQNYTRIIGAEILSKEEVLRKWHQKKDNYTYNENERLKDLKKIKQWGKKAWKFLHSQDIIKWRGTEESSK